MKVTKKPVTIEAVKWTGKELSEYPEWINESLSIEAPKPGSMLMVEDEVKIWTLEGVMIANPGDYILRGIKGELYPCKTDIFLATYVFGENTVEEEENPLKKAHSIIKNDPELRRVYVDNIAMAFKDHYTRYKKRHDYKDLPFDDLHIISNTAAEYFMDLLLAEYGEGMPVREPLGIAAAGEVYPSKETSIYAVIETGKESEQLPFGGAHEYILRHNVGFENNDHKYSEGTTHLKFVRRLESGEMVPGLQSEQLIIMLKDRTHKLNKKFPSPQNEKMLIGLDMFLEACKERIDDRISRGVMGDLKK
jgi:hypothetical protein